jgi:hypothetical protein
VRTILSRNGMTLQRTATRRATEKPTIHDNEWFLPDLAAELGMPAITLYSWVRRAWVAARQLTSGRTPYAWVIRADHHELARLRALRAAPKLGWRSEKWIANA